MARAVVSRTYVERQLVNGRGTASPSIPGGQPPPVDPEIPNAPVLQGTPAPLSVSETAVTLASSWNQHVNAYIEYGLTAAYGSVTPEETSFDYTTHIQTIQGLTADTLYHYRWVVENAAGQQTVSDDYTFTTSAPPSTDVFTDYTMPTGSGWTDGSDSISATQSWMAANVPNGTGPDDQSRVLLGAGRTRIWSQAYDYDGDQYIRFDGQGTPVHTTTPTPQLGLPRITQSGNTGGCILRSTSTGSTTPSRTQGRGLFASMTNRTGPGYSAVGLSWVGIIFEGNGQQTPNTSLASQGVEHQAGIWLWGADGGGAGVIEDCVFRYLKGDAVSFVNGGGSYDATAKGDERTRDYTMRRCDIRVMGRVGLFPGAYDNVRVEDTLIKDCGFAFVDFEPDYYHMRLGSFYAYRVTFDGTANWGLSYYMAPIFITRIVGRSAGQTFYQDGRITFEECVFNNRHGRNGNGTAPASNATSDWPWEVQAYLGPITKPGGFTALNCERTAFTHTQSFMQAAGYTGPISVTGCKGFGVSNPSTNFVTSTGGSNPGGITQSGNT